MTDFARTGARCCAKQMIRGHAGTVRRLEQGTIAYELEDMGRQLILVRWDSGVSTHVFANEIEIIELPPFTGPFKIIPDPAI